VFKNVYFVPIFAAGHVAVIYYFAMYLEFLFTPLSFVPGVLAWLITSVRVSQTFHL